MPRSAEKFEDEELQNLLNESTAQSQQEHTEKLEINQKVICDRLHRMGKI